MPILGPSSLMDIALPTGLDAATILNFEMRDGMTPEEVIALAATTIGEVNQELEAQYGGLVLFTDQLSARYRQASGSRRKTPIKSEFKGPDPIRSDSVGHMFTVAPLADAVAWSADYLREAHRMDVSFDLQEIRDSWRDRVDFDVITRMFSNTDIAVGSSGFSPGWAIGTGTSLNYIPPNWRGYSFDSTHTHFKRTNGAISNTNVVTALNDMVIELSHHGHTGNKVALVSKDDVTKYTTMAGFINLYPSNVEVNAGSSDILRVIGQAEGIPGETFGYFSTIYGWVELKYHERIPTGYLWMGKSYGSNNMENPLAIRYNPNKSSGFGMMVKPKVTSDLVPELDYLMFEAEHGINVNNRTAGIAYEIKTGGTTWENPSIT